MTPHFAPRAGRRTILAAAAAALLAGGGCQIGGGNRPAGPAGPPPDSVVVTPIAFSDLNEKEGDVYNASGIVPLADSRFLVVDNNTNDSLLELDLSADGRQAAPLARRELVGLPEKVVDDKLNA